MTTTTTCRTEPRSLHRAVRSHAVTPRRAALGRPTRRSALTPSRNEGLVVGVTGRYHGLGNRMRVVLGAQALARFEGRSFRYVWPTGRGFGARLDALWEVHAPRWPTIVP